MFKKLCIFLVFIFASNVSSALSIYYDETLEALVVEYNFDLTFSEPGLSFGISYDLLPIDPEYGDYPPARIVNLEAWSADFSIVDSERVLNPIYIDPTKTLLMENYFWKFLVFIFDQPNFETGLEVTIGGITYSAYIDFNGEIWAGDSGSMDWVNNLHNYEPVNISERIVTAILAGETIYVSVVPIVTVGPVRYPWLGEYYVGSVSFNGSLFGHVSAVPGIPLTKGSYEFMITDGEASITRFLCNNSEAIIPGEIDGVPVTSIAESAFQLCENLNVVTIPDNVTSIGDYAFFHCINLETVNFGGGLLKIGNSAFAYCTELSDLKIPDNVATIGDLAFNDCLSLSNVTIGNGLTNIGDLAFWGCSSLRSVTIGGGLTAIGDFAFLDSTNLTKVYFLGEPPYIETSVFANSDPNLIIFYIKDTPGWGALYSQVQTQPFTPFVLIENSGTVLSFQYAGGVVQESLDMSGWFDVTPQPEPGSLIPMSMGSGQKRFLRLKPSSPVDPPQVIIEGFGFIPEGDFLMGLPEGEPGSWAGDTQHAVSLSSAFYMKDTPVTYDEWTAVLDWTLLPENIALGYALPAGGMGAKISESTGSHPVTRVSWYDAILWCNAKSEMDGKTPVYYLDAVHSTVYRSGSVDLLNTWVDWQADGYRLPTEAEWEYACRAGTTTSFFTGPITATGFDFCPNLDAAGWYGGNSGINTHPVGKKLPNAWGLYDVHGNIWEWTWDRHDEFTASPQVDPIGPDTGSNRMMRGGSHNNNAESCQSSSRFPNGPGNSGSYSGLRIAISLAD